MPRGVYIRTLEDRENRKKEKNHLWKGDAAHIFTKHRWMNNNFGKPQLCEHCGTTEIPKGKKIWFHWANISGKYIRERYDWKCLCALCHRKFDAHLLVRGEDQFTAKLTNEKVIELREMKRLNPKISQRILAEKFGICQSTVGRVLSRRYWKHIPEAQQTLKSFNNPQNDKR